jgi:hypothetical protein
MQRSSLSALLGTALLVFVAAAGGATELTVSSILAAQQAGAPAAGLVAMVNSPANTVAMTAADVATLRDAGIPETVLSAIWARIPARTPAPAALQPDDFRLVDTVRLIASGMSGTNIAEQVRQSGESYNLSVNDLLYLKQNNASESTIAALMATRPVAPTVVAAAPIAAPASAPIIAPVSAPAETVFDNLVLVKRGFWHKDSAGRLVLKGDTLTWEGARDRGENFTFETSGLEKVWFTCEARSSGNFCYQINFKIVRGDHYKFRDGLSDSGSNAAVTKVMETMRTSFPRVNYSTPNVDD